jgi:hypothetical protein
MEKVIEEVGDHCVRHRQQPGIMHLKPNVPRRRPGPKTLQERVHVEFIAKASRKVGSKGPKRLCEEMYRRCQMGASCVPFFLHLHAKRTA